jgi:signal transduction histidine kinase/ActR/RegA family two-component response regulator
MDGASGATQNRPSRVARGRRVLRAAHRSKQASACVAGSAPRGKDRASVRAFDFTLVHRFSMSALQSHAGLDSCFGGVAFAALLDRLPAAAYTCDAVGRITYFNARAVSFWGRVPRLHDMADRFCGSWRLCATDGTPIRHDDCWMARALHEGRHYDGREIVVERPDGSRRVALAHASPLRDANGRIVGGLNVLVDITGQKNAETRLIEANHRKDVFLATLAHELRNPLAPLRCAAPLLRALQPGGDAEPVLAMIDRQVEHLVRLVDDLLDASRITRGKLELRRERVDVEAVVATAVEAARPQIDACRHTLAIQRPRAPTLVDVDPVRLAQVLENLLHNAAKFTPDGGNIDIAIERDGGMVDIRVRDNGVGIAPDVLPHVFDLFTQEERCVEGMKAGLGVGLALVRKLVELHAGTVCARSEGEGRGSEFTVRLPAMDAAGAPDDGTRHQAQASPAREQRVLIVDDNHDAAESLAMLVELLGSTAHVAFDGPSALADAPDFKPTVALLDLTMPGMDGFELARRLRKGEATRAMRLIALSGRGEDAYRHRSRDAGFDQHLVKPVDLPTLQAILAGRTPA